jgi:hypothetical protein
MEWIALALVVAIAAAAAGFWWQHAGPWRLVKARRVVVNLRSGQAIQGLLVRQSGPLLFLAEAQLHEGNNNPVPIDGQAVVERPGIDFIQIL